MRSDGGTLVRVLTDVEGSWCLVAFKLEYEEVAGLAVVAEPQGHSYDHRSSQLSQREESFHHFPSSFPSTLLSLRTPRSFQTFKRGCSMNITPVEAENLTGGIKWVSKTFPSGLTVP